MPNRFFKANGAVEDFLGNDWQQKWGKALERQEQAMFSDTPA